MSNEKKYSYLAKNTFLFAISSFGSKILVFFLVPLYTNILTTAEYGTVDIISTSAFLLMHVFTLNIADSVLRFAIERKQDSEKVLSYGLRILLVGSFLLAGMLAALHFLHVVDWSGYCYIFLFLEFFVTSLHQILSNYLRAIDKVKEVAVSGIIVTLITILLNILLLICFKFGIIGYLISVVAGSLAACVYCLIVIRISPIRIFKNCCDYVSQKAMRSYSIPLIFNGIAWWMNNSLDKYFVVWMCGVSGNGILSVAYKIPTILSTFHTIFSKAWSLSAIKEFDKDDSDGFFSETYTLYNTGLIILCSFLIITNIPLAHILFKKEFFDAWRYSSILLFATLFSSLSAIVGSVFVAVKNSLIYAVSTLTAAIINCILNAVLINFFGTIGAAIATAFSFVCVWLIRLIFSRKYIKWKINILRDIIAYFLLALQIVFEHLESHLYLGQGFILIVLILLYRKSLVSILKTAKKIVLKLKGKKSDSES